MLKLAPETVALIRAHNRGVPAVHRTQQQFNTNTIGRDCSIVAPMTPALAQWYQLLAVAYEAIRAAAPQRDRVCVFGGFLRDIVRAATTTPETPLPHDVDVYIETAPDADMPAVLHGIAQGVAEALVQSRVDAAVSLWLIDRPIYTIPPQYAAVPARTLSHERSLVQAQLFLSIQSRIHVCIDMHCGPELYPFDYQLNSLTSTSPFRSQVPTALLQVQPLCALIAIPDDERTRAICDDIAAGNARTTHCYGTNPCVYSTRYHRKRGHELQRRGYRLVVIDTCITPGCINAGRTVIMDAIRGETIKTDRLASVFGRLAQMFATVNIADALAQQLYAIIPPPLQRNDAQAPLTTSIHVTPVTLSMPQIWVDLLRAHVASGRDLPTFDGTSPAVYAVAQQIMPYAMVSTNMIENALEQQWPFERIAATFGECLHEETPGASDTFAWIRTLVHGVADDMARAIGTHSSETTPVCI